MVAGFSAASLTKPAVTSILSAALVAPMPSAAKPAVACNAALSARVIVRVVSFVTTAEVISETVNTTPAVLEPSPSISQASFVQSICDLISTPSAPAVPKLVPVNVIVPALLS